MEASGPPVWGGAETRAISPDVGFSHEPTPMLCQPSQPLDLPHSVESSLLSEFLVRTRVWLRSWEGIQGTRTKRWDG